MADAAPFAIHRRYTRFERDASQIKYVNFSFGRILGELRTIVRMGGNPSSGHYFVLWPLLLIIVHNCFTRLCVPPCERCLHTLHFSLVNVNGAGSRLNFSTHWQVQIPPHDDECFRHYFCIRRSFVSWQIPLPQSRTVSECSCKFIICKVAV